MKCTELPNGFEIEPDGPEVGQQVRVTLLENGLGFKVEVKDSRYAIDTFNFDPVYYAHNEFSLLDYYKLTDSVTSRLTYRWKPKPHAANEDHDYHYQQKIKEWKTKKIGRILGKYLHEQWERLLEKCDPTVVAVQRAVFANIFSQPSPLMLPEVYADKYFVSDLLNYRAASHFLYSYQRDYRYNQKHKNNFDWLAYYAKDFQKYTSLNKTLTNLPGGIPVGLLNTIVNRGEKYTYHRYHKEYIPAESLAYDDTIAIPRPFTDRLELMLWLSACKYDEISTIAANATHEQIITCLRRMSDHIHEKLSLRSIKSISRLAHFLSDYPDTHHGNIVGLLDKSIRWHNAEREKTAERNRLHALEMAEQLTALPPVDLPDHPGITFLNSVLDVSMEGEKMKHCVAGHAWDAVNGRTYLFHIEYNRELATASIKAANGQIGQCLGPGNRSNKAAKWAEGKLKEWGKQLRGKEPIIRYQKPRFSLRDIPPAREQVYAEAYDEVPF